jgi:hypothetical protein
MACACVCVCVRVCVCVPPLCVGVGACNAAQVELAPAVASRCVLPPAPACMRVRALLSRVLLLLLLLLPLLPLLGWLHGRRKSTPGRGTAVAWCRRRRTTAAPGCSHSEAVALCARWRSCSAWGNVVVDPLTRALARGRRGCSLRQPSRWGNVAGAAVRPQARLHTLLYHGRSIKLITPKLGAIRDVRVRFFQSN